MAKLERRLIDTGVYESVTVVLAPTARATGGLRPVVVNLAERPPRTLELGAAYSATAAQGFDASFTPAGSGLGAYTSIDGSGVDAKWIHYNVLRRADTITLTAKLYDIQQVLDLLLALPDWRRGDQTLRFGADALNERTPAYDDAGGGLRATVERSWSKTTFVTVGGYLDYVAIREKTAVNGQATPVGENLKLFITTGLAAFALDRSNSPLNPTRGWRLSAKAEPTWITGDRNLAYLKAQAQASAYLPLDRAAATVIAGRVKLGAVLGGSIPDVPTDRRFFAGGGGSVRGYSYQAVGPRLSDNTPEGGLSLAEGSIEARRRITPRNGAWSPSWTPARWAWEPRPISATSASGPGIGARYDLGFGPLRLDIATPAQSTPGRCGVPGLPQHRPELLMAAAPRSRGRRAAFWLAIGAIGLIVLGGVLAAVVRYGPLTPAGRRFIEARATGLKVGRFGRLRIEGLAGDPWRAFSIARLSIADGNGVWLDARDIAIRWRFSELLQHRVALTAITARSVTLLRRPTLTPAEPPSPLPVSIQIDAARTRVEMAPAFSGRRGVYDLSTALRVERSGGAKGWLSAASVLQAGDFLKLDFDLGRHDTFALAADAREAGGGALAGMAGMAADQPFLLAVRADGSANAGRFFIETRVGGATPLEARGAWDASEVRRTGASPSRPPACSPAIRPWWAPRRASTSMVARRRTGSTPWPSRSTATTSPWTGAERRISAVAPPAPMAWPSTCASPTRPGSWPFRRWARRA